MNHLILSVKHIKDWLNTFHSTIYTFIGKDGSFLLEAFFNRNEEESHAMDEKFPKINLKEKYIENQERLSFPGRKSLIETIEDRLNVQGDVWIHHAYRVSEDPFMIEQIHDIQYQDSVIIPSILHTLLDKVGGQRTTSLAAISGMKKPDLLFLLDPASMNLAVIYKEKLWITEILLREAPFLYPSPYERTNALTNILLDIPQIEASYEDISIEINGHRTDEGIEQKNIFVPLDSNYRPVLGGKDPASRFKSSVKRLSEAGELILMISDAITSSAKMYLGTVNIRLDEDLIALEYPQDVKIAGLKIYKRYLDVIEVSSPFQPQNPEFYHVSFQIYRAEISRPIRGLIKMLHV